MISVNIWRLVYVTPFPDQVQPKFLFPYWVGGLTSPALILVNIIFISVPLVSLVLSHQQPLTFRVILIFRFILNSIHLYFNLLLPLHCWLILITGWWSSLYLSIVTVFSLTKSSIYFIRTYFYWSNLWSQWTLWTIFPMLGRICVHSVPPRRYC